jgi:hypothetical protein
MFSMFEGKRKITCIIMLFCLLAFLGISFHGHSDGETHSDDCSLCAALLHSSALPAVAIALTFCFIVLFSITSFIQSLQSSPEIYRQGSRAPPFFV